MSTGCLTFTVPPDGAGVRLDVFIASAADNGGISRSAAARLTGEGRVTVNGKTAGKNARLRAGDTVSVDIPQPVPDSVGAEDIPLDVIYEDSDIIVVNKPQGMVVHPAAGNREGTLVAALLHHCGDSLSGIGGVTRPGIVHRIDKDTSGLLVVAKNDAAHLSLAAQIKAHTARRTYVALLVGEPREDSGRIDAPIGRHPADRKKMAVFTAAENGKSRSAVTDWQVLERYGGASLVECRLETGRTHQIRVHMASAGHPVLGDPVYGGNRNPVAEKYRGLISGQCLHARLLCLRHPRTGEQMTFEAPVPDNMQRLIVLLRQSAAN